MVFWGYTEGYEDPAENYSISELDGKSTWLTGEINDFLANREMLLVVAAGNDGHTKWKTLSSPADSRLVLSVGAVGYKVWRKASFSSVGNNLAYIKPEVSCFAQLGTSFSAPVITGLLACIWQYSPTLTSKELKSLLISSAHLFPYGNNYIGYGVPQCGGLFRQGEVNENRLKTVKSKRNKVNVEVSAEHNYCNVFHKKDQFRVDHQIICEKRGEEIVIRRPGKQIRFSTISCQEQAIEIEWTK